MADTHLTLLSLLTLTLLSMTTALEEVCPTSWPGGVQLGVPEYFYPFDPGVDMMVPVGDDTNSPRLTLATPFPFYGQFFTYMYVSTNGVLYFADPPTYFPLDGIPLKNMPLIGPLFVDTDSSLCDGRAYYHATTESDILCWFSTYVVAKRLDASKFNATWAFIATWHNLTFWKGNSSDPVNTFQVVMATDGHNSFALFNYGELNWSIAPDVMHSRVGFNSGFEDHHYVIAESGTGTTADLHALTGNTRDIGRWLFRINKDTINGHGSEGLVASFTLEEKKAITLSCPSANLDYTSRVWLRGYFDDSDRTLLFSQTNSSTITSHFGDRMDVSVDNATFELTIGEARLGDDSYFSCEVVYGMPLRRTFDNVDLQMYIQPEITMTGLYTTTFTKNTKVTVTCTIPRLYPAIEPGAFKLLWGALDDLNSVEQEFKMRKNPDNSYKYTITRTKTVTIMDNGKVVTCSVVPVRGSQVFISKNLTVNVEVNPAPLLAKKRVNIAVIAGAITGGTCFLILIVLGVFCIRRSKLGHSQASSPNAGIAAIDNPTYEVPHQYGEDPGQATGGPVEVADKAPIVEEELYEEIFDLAPFKKGGKRREDENTDTGYYGPETSPSCTLDEDPCKEMSTSVPTFEEWVQTHHISPDTEAKLRQHQLTSTEDLKRLRDEDVKELGLVVGERNRLMEALSALK